MFDKTNTLFNDYGFGRLPPWWMIRMEKDFERVGIESRRVTGFTKRGEKIVEACSSDKATHWVVYGTYYPHVTANSRDDFREFPTEQAARMFQQQLLDAYPHLGYENEEKDMPIPLSEIGFLQKMARGGAAWISS